MNTKRREHNTSQAGPISAPSRLRLLIPARARARASRDNQLFNYKHNHKFKKHFGVSRQLFTPGICHVIHQCRFRPEKSQLFRSKQQYPGGCGVLHCTYQWVLQAWWPQVNLRPLAGVDDLMIFHSHEWHLAQCNCGLVTRLLMTNCRQRSPRGSLCPRETVLPLRCVKSSLKL